MSALGVAAAGLLLVSGVALWATWIGYPLFMGMWARWRPRRWQRLPLDAPGAAWPRVSVIVAAHDEAAHIRARIRNLLAQDYPAGKLEIIVSEDGSSDGTAAAARAAAAGARVPVQVLSAAQRLGKAAAINRGVEAAGGEILVFTDANNLFAPQALRHLAAPFADARVGAVTGRKAVAEDCGLGGGEGVYWRYENWLVTSESAAGGTVAAFGEALALQRSFFRALPTRELANDDLYLALMVLAQSQRLVAAPEARSWEMGAADAVSEWERRRRMAAGHWGAVLAARRQGASWHGADAVKILFHHLLRPASALWTALALVASAGLLLAAAVPAGGRMLGAAVMLGFVWTAVVALTRALGGRLGRGEAPYFFCLAVTAAAVGAWQRLVRGQTIAWRKVRRAQAPGPKPAHPPGILNGLFWASSSFLLGKLFSFGSVIILARLLAPKAFGEVAIALTAIMVFEILGTLGLTSALVFEEQAVDAAANLCFWITLATSTLEFAAAWLLAPALAAFFHDPTLRLMVRSLAVCLPLLALGNTHDFLLRRRLSFRTKFVPDIGQAAVKGLAAIALALAGLGAWSLIWGQVLGTLAATALLWKVTPWRPHRGFDRAVFRRMVSYAKHIYFLDGSGVLLFNLDTLTIGRMLGDTMVGYYTLAVRLPDVVLISVLNVVTRVTFPSFSRLQNDPPHMRRTLLDTARYTGLLTLPMAVGLAMLAPAMVYAVYGRQWGPSIAVLEVLALYEGLRCLFIPFGDAYKAIGRPDILTRTTAFWWVALPPAMILGAHWGGIVGVAWGHVVTRVGISLLNVYFIAKYLKIAPGVLLRCYAPALQASAIMAAALWVARPLAQHWSPRLELVALVPLGALVYAAAVYLLHPQIAQAAVARLRRQDAAAAASVMEPAA